MWKIPKQAKQKLEPVVNLSSAWCSMQFSEFKAHSVVLSNDHTACVMLRVCYEIVNAVTAICIRVLVFQHTGTLAPRVFSGAWKTNMTDLLVWCSVTRACIELTSTPLPEKNDSVPPLQPEFSPTFLVLLWEKIFATWSNPQQNKVLCRFQ